MVRGFLIVLLTMLCLSGHSMAAEHGVILLYHHVATDTPPSTSISPTDFRAHLEYLRDNDFNVIGLDTLIEALRNGRPVPDRAVAITFDDGYDSIYNEAFPMLQSFGFPFTLFLSTDPINRSQANYMSWEQVREMSDAGVVIANHMIEHPYMLTRQEGETDQRWLERQRVEILTAEETITSQTGQSHHYLAYPYGEFDPAIKALLGELNFVGLAQNSGAVGYNSDFLALPRYPLASIYADLDSARTKLDTKAFNVSLVSPASPVTKVRNPSVTLKFGPGDYNLEQIGCFANSQAIPMTWLDKESGLVKLIPDQEYSGRRWRYICTAPDPQSRRYYWYSVQWIKPDS
ncbi:MAG TPA: xylanase [Gammaproteobacteria bacterium]|nr:polysaccharide deacetylase family protein [Gammaproteobacteria bacterium]MDP6733827.1 polysaccharide deacetylase family protein [Gammaproteobacteria bacterium]HAJ76636.1 xylanase [Gammaproteobacteria bacterium]